MMPSALTASPLSRFNCTDARVKSARLVEKKKAAACDSARIDGNGDATRQRGPEREIGEAEVSNAFLRECQLQLETEPVDADVRRAEPEDQRSACLGDDIGGIGSGVVRGELELQRVQLDGTKRDSDRNGHVETFADGACDRNRLAILRSRVSY